MATELFPSALDGGAIERIQARFEEPDWLKQLRLAAQQHYDEMPRPSRTDEKWRRTDLSAFDYDRIQPMGERGPNARVELGIGIDTAGEDIASVRAKAAARETLVNQGVVFGTFSSVLRDQPEAFQRWLTEGASTPNATATRVLEGGIPADANLFETLARAVGTDGYAVYVPRNADVAVPLHAKITAFEEHLEDYPSANVLNLEDSLERDNLAACVYPRSIIVAEPFSRVTIVEDFSAERGVGPYLAAGLTEVFVGEGAEVTIVSYQDWSTDTWNFHTQRSHVAAGGKIVTLTVNLGGKVTKGSVEGSLIGVNAQSQMLGLIFGSQAQHFDIYTLQDHQAGQTLSNLLFKNALRDESKSIYSGLIRVDEGVQGADAYQANRNLLLSHHAKADSQPMLEILNNEVRCTHGATMGPVDPEQLFYLQSRGLPYPEASRMVVQGFFEEALEQVRDASVRGWLHDRIEERIEV